MIFARRRLLSLAGAFAALPYLEPVAWAVDYPSRSVRVIVGFPAGGTADIAARLMGAWLSGHLGQQFVVETRPGAATNIATEEVARAAPDGYTLLLVTQSNAINASLYDHLNFNFVSDIAPVGSIFRVPGVMVVHPSVPAKTIPEFIDYARAIPGKINMGSGGNGSAQHLYGELFMLLTGINMTHVPYRDQPLTDLIAGQLQVIFNPLPSTMEFIKTNKLRALAVTTRQRSAALPDIPALAEFVPDYEASGWFGLGAPAKVPMPIIDVLSGQVQTALADSAMQARLGELGAEPISMTPAEFSKFIAGEADKWGKVVRAAHIEVD